jgi:hypothetical protein
MASEVAKQQRTIVELDGFNDFVSEQEGEEVNVSSRVIQGTKLKFLDPRWVIAEQDVTRMHLTVIGVRNVVNRWSDDNVSIETRILEPGEKFPNFEQLNNTCDRSEWRESFGKLVGPWSGQHCVYFIDEKLNPYTWASPINTIGSAICVREFVDQVKRVRRFRGENVYAVVELSHVDFRTGFGLRQRPHLQILEWVLLGPGRGTELPAPDTATLVESKGSGTPPEAKPVAPISRREELGDEVPW